jgi:hypothetical protein
MRTKQIARALGISPKTADQWIQQVNFVVFGTLLFAFAGRRVDVAHTP